MQSVSVDDLTADEIEQLLAWRYSGNYGRYDLTPDDRVRLADPDSHYWAVRETGALIGFVCVGAEARVPGMLEDQGAIDVGVGFRPDLTGRGHSRSVLPQVLDAVIVRLKPAALRATVATWNKRAQRATEIAGFRQVGIHENDHGTYVIYRLEL